MKLMIFSRRKLFSVFFSLLSFFVVAEHVQAVVTSGAIQVSPSSFAVGTQNTLSLSGPFQGETDGSSCTNPPPNPDQIVNSKLAYHVNSITYHIIGPNGDTGKTGTFSYGSHFSVGRSGVSVACGSTDTNYSGYRVWEFDFAGNVTVDVAGLPAGQYQIYLDSQEQVQDASPGPDASDGNFSGASGPSFVISGPPPEPPATIKVRSNLSTSWNVTGPTNFSGTGTTNGSNQTGPAGTYIISGVPDLSCYNKSITPSSSQSVAPSSEITFTITYDYTCGGSGPGAFSLSSSYCSAWPSPQVEINFGASSGATSYELQRRVGSGSYVTVFSGTYEQLNAYTDAAAQNTTYEYRIVAYNSFGSQVSSNTLTITTSQANCAPPPNTPACTPGSQTVSVSGSASLSASGGNGTYSWSALGGNPSSGSGSNFSVSYSTSGTKTVTVTSSGNSVNCTVEVTGAPVCMGAGAQDAVATGTGSFYLYAYGVQGATSVYFPTWSDTNGQDDIQWYQASYIGSNTWRATVNLANHRPGNPDYGTFSSHVYMSNSSYANVFCGTANFTLSQTDHVPVGNLDAANCSIIGGWAFDPDTSSSPISVHIYRDGPAGVGTFVTSTVTDGNRADVNAAYGITGNHGFTISTPLLSGSHSIYAYAINNNPNGGNPLLTNSPIAFNCSNPVPAGDLKINAVDGPISLAYGSAATLSWTSQGVDSCSVTPGSFSDLSGSQSTGAITNSTIYTLYCTGQWGSVSDTVTANISGGSSSCTVSTSPTGSLNPNVTVTVGNWDGTAHEYDIDCTNNGSYEYTNYLTTNPNTFSNICSYTVPSTLLAHIRNLNTQAEATCSTPSGPPVTPFDYSLSNSGTSNVTKAAGNAFTQNTITKTLITGPTEPVTISASGLPANVSYSVSNNPCSPNCSSVITFTVAPSAPVGTFPITVTGSPLGRTTTFNLVISSPVISVSCSANPTTALLGQNITWTGSVIGGTAPLTYAWSGSNIPTSPAPSTNPYVKSYTTTGQKSAQLSVTDANGAQSTCPPATAQINFNPDFEEF